MDAKQVANELLEEIRSNTKLRHRLGMEEGSESEILDDQHTPEVVVFKTKEGQPFFLEVSE